MSHNFGEVKIPEKIQQWFKNSLNRKITISNERILELDSTDTIHIVYIDIIEVNYKQKIESVKNDIESITSLTKIIMEWFRINKLSQNKYWTKAVGDGYIFGFRNIEHAIKLIKYLYTKIDDKNFKIKIGLNTGIVGSTNDIFGNEELVGPGIDNAIRITNLADNGNIFASEDTFNFLKNNLQHTLDGNNLGEFVLKHGNKFPVYNIYDKKGQYGDKYVSPKILEKSSKFSLDDRKKKEFIKILHTK